MYSYRLSFVYYNVAVQMSKNQDVHNFRGFRECSNPIFGSVSITDLVVQAPPISPVFSPTKRRIRIPNTGSTFHKQMPELANKHANSNFPCYLQVLE